jgi:hypothetical protein
LKLSILNGRYDIFEVINSDKLKGFRSKAFPASLTGVLLNSSSKGSIVTKV